jgi:hypothetical protein
LSKVGDLLYLPITRPRIEAVIGTLSPFGLRVTAVITCSIR